MTLIVTESLCCMTSELCRANNTVIVPIECFVEGKRYSDRITNDVPPPDNSYSIPPSADIYEKSFRKAISAGHKVLCITTSKKISSSYENAVAAAEGFSPEVVRVFDSGVVAGGLFLMVKHIRENFGDDSELSCMIDSLEDYRKRITVKFTSNTTERLITTNRLAGSDGGEKSTSDQKPIFVMEDGGIIHKTSASPGFREISELVSILDDPKYVVLHYLEKNAYLRDVGMAIKEKCPNAKIFTLPITLSLKINLGTSIIGIIGD
ncbi:MAG: hypothetical protein E7578_04475 [Ruminococcaceae bacterium]|nr:hypothetical protein [Oscillospiraceae bacterium]